ncbi:MAG: type II secretion system protein [Acidobacteriota bacterium]
MLGQARSIGNPGDRHRRGFTLVELVLVIMVLGLLAAVGSTMIVDTFKTTGMVTAENTSEVMARYALERLAREIREIKYDSTNGAYCITSTMSSTTTLTYYKTSGTYNSTCATNADTVTISYDAANKLVTLSYASIPNLTSTLARNVSSFALNNYNIGDALATTSTARFVVISLTVTDPTSGQSTSQRVRVNLRNA